MANIFERDVNQQKDFVMRFYDPFIHTTNINVEVSKDKKTVAVQLIAQCLDGKVRAYNGFKQTFNTIKEAKRFQKQLEKKSEEMSVFILYQMAKLPNILDLLTN